MEKMSKYERWIVLLNLLQFLILVLPIKSWYNVDVVTQDRSYRYKFGYQDIAVYCMLALYFCALLSLFWKRLRAELSGLNPLLLTKRITLIAIVLGLIFSWSYWVQNATPGIGMILSTVLGILSLWFIRCKLNQPD